MLFSNSISNLPRNVTFNNTVLDKVDTIKFLGLTIDENLSWKIHIDNISKTISRNIGIKQTFDGSFIFATKESYSYYIQQRFFFPY